MANPHLHTSMNYTKKSDSFVLKYLFWRLITCLPLACQHYRSPSANGQCASEELLEDAFRRLVCRADTKQLGGDDVESTELLTVDPSLPKLKQLGVKWMVEISQKTYK